MELHNATVHGRGYKTRFPVLLDGSCNGIQHLALMTRDEKAGLLVNLTNSNQPTIRLAPSCKLGFNLRWPDKTA
jgi:DNA-directed RNA polymerase